MTDIKSLAQFLDISIGTVSRALNNKPDVSPKTRERVMQAALELGYVPNQSGRSLRKGATQTIGFVITTGNSAARGGDDFFMRVIDSAQLTLKDQNYDVVILPCHSTDEPDEFLRRIILRGIVDAVILTATRQQDPRIALLAGSKTPFLTLGRSEVPGEYSWIDLDFEQFAAHSIDRLVTLGHRRIALTLPQSDANLGFVLHRAYRDALARHAIDYDPDLVIRAEQSENGGKRVTRHLLGLAAPPSALLLSFESMAIGVYSGLRECGLKPGADLSVISLRQDPQLRFLDPPLSAYDFSLRELGHELGSAIVNVIRGTAPPLRKIWPMTFVPTDSIQPPRD